ncbi:MAG TPA: bacteriohopanetetrol glucosamine biosynthesis glycosyltransferase HpnI [Vicinamibacterales bacterium]|jgi:ceramide glucosyltransferase
MTAACLPLAYSALAIDTARRTLRRRDVRRGSSAPVSVLKPVRGVDRHAYERFATFCRQDHPDFEVLFGVADLDDAVIPIIRRLAADFPTVRVRLICPIMPEGPNAKVSIVRRLAAEASHDLLVIADSDVAVPSSMLERVAAPFAEAAVGAVTCLYRGESSSFAGDLEALGISTEFMPGVLVAERVEGLRFALGAVMAVRRAALDAIGGFDALIDYCADDFELGRRVADAGFLVRFADCVVQTGCEPAGVADLLRRELRWAMTQRQSRPGAWPIKVVVTQALPWATAAAWAAPSAASAAGWIGAYALARLGVAWSVGAAVLGDDTVRRRWWLLPLRDAMTCAISAAAIVSTRIEWRGRRFTLRRGRLVALDT